MDRGKLVILAMFVLAATLGLLAVFYHYSHERKAVAWWGTAAARLFVEAPQVELLHLVPATPGGHAAPVEQVVRFGNRVFDVIKRRDVSSGRGLIHLRSALVEDALFDWSAPGHPCQPQWEYAIRFSNGVQSATILVSLDCPQVMLAEAPAGAPHVGQSLGSGGLKAGFSEFFADHLR